MAQHLSREALAAELDRLVSRAIDDYTRSVATAVKLAEYAGVGLIVHSPVFEKVDENHAAMTWGFEVMADMPAGSWEIHNRPSPIGDL